MSDIINILPDNVANQIAAGEVVDRPASAVKELLENAIDAGATSIQLILRDAGRTLIQVIDNGCGMSDSDARLCFERHATSKIHAADDLFAIRTMGFRGEALASIAAVAQVELRTRQLNNELGTCVLIEGCEVKSQEPCSCNAGTSIAVKNLFFNIPARRNFLKKDSVELSHIDDIFRRVAIVNNHVAFTLHHNGKLLYDLRAGNKAQRIAAIFGSGTSERLYPISESTELVSVEGYVGKPEHVRKTRNEQYIFVNNRFIKHLALSTAVEKAYAELIPERTYPSYFLFIQVDPSRIDVNIHPTKTEVRFVDEHALFAILRAATKKAIGQFSLATEIEFNPSTDIDFSPAPSEYTPQEPHITFNPDYNPFHTTSESRSGGALRSSGTSFGSTTGSRMRPSSSWEEAYAAAKSEDLTFGFSDDADADVEEQPAISTPASPLSYKNTYIISTLKSGLLVIHQQRANERILFEEFMDRRRANADSPVGAQQLLFPVTCTFSPSDGELMNELLGEIRSMGFAIDGVNATTYVVTATPPNVQDGNLQSLFEQLLADYKGAMMQKFGDRDTAICQSMARQMAIKAGTPLQPEEMQSIIGQLFACQVPNLAPNGKKTMIILNELDLEEKFR